MPSSMLLPATVRRAITIARNLVQRPRSVALAASWRLTRSSVSFRHVPLVNRLSDRYQRVQSAQELSRRGEYSKANSLLDSPSTDVERGVRNRALRMLQDLNADIPPSPTCKSLSLGRPRVVMLLNNSLPHTVTGYTTRTHSLLKALRDVGVEVLAVTRPGYEPTGPGSSRYESVVDGIRYVHLPGSDYFRRTDSLDHDVAAVTEVARNFGATILHTTTPFRNPVILSRVAQKLGVPWLYEVRGRPHETWLSRQRAADFQAELGEYYCGASQQEIQAQTSASRVLTLSDQSRGLVHQQGVPRSHIFVVPNAVDSALIGRRYDSPKLRRKFGLSRDHKYFGTITSVVEYEGLDAAVRALQFLPGHLRLLVVGEGSSLPDLKRLADSLGVQDRVQFVGKQPSQDIWEWYACLDVFVVPRKDREVTRTVTPIKPLIALALGVPVVASDLPALQEVTGGFARFVPPEDPMSLATAVSEASVESTSGITESVRAFLESRTWKSNALLLKTLYQS